MAPNALLIAGVDASIDSQPFYPPKLSLDWELQAAIQPKQREYTSSYGVALAQEVERVGWLLVRSLAPPSWVSWCP